MRVPRRRDEPDDKTVARLERAAKRKQAADEELRAAVYAAADAGGSIRVIAEFAQLSTSTVRIWLKQRP